MKVRVLARHIKKGNKRNECSCPIALAIKEKQKKRCSVGNITVDIFLPKTKRSYFLPKKARQFVLSFDNDKIVKPFTFTMKSRGHNSNKTP